MQVIDWSQLKEGDVFRVPGPVAQETRYPLGLTYGEGAVYKKAGDRFTLLDDTSFKFGCADITRIKHKQPVEVAETQEEQARIAASGLVHRVGQTTGTDPEIFVVHGQNELFPAFKFLRPQEETAKHAKAADLTHYAYRDGFAAECYIQPQTCHGYLIDFIRAGLQDVIRSAKAIDPTSKLTIQGMFEIPKDIIQSAAPDEVALGCTPSLNVYNDNPLIPNDAREFPWRFAGGHVHVQVNRPTKRAIANMIKGCDIMAAVPAVAIFAEIDKSERRQYYGRAGEYRTPKYGFEYRVLSNAWLGHPKIAHLMYNLVRIGAKVGKAGYQESFGLSTDQAREIINYCDVKAAREFTLRNADAFATLLRLDGAVPTVASGSNLKAFKKAVAEGVEALLPSYKDVESNWRLTSNWMRHSNNSAETWGRAAA